MRSILRLFAKSPFKALGAHMDKGHECYSMLEPLFEAAFAEDYDKVDEVFRQIHVLEHEADKLKDEIRESLPRSLFLPVARRDLLATLKAQDSIPDAAEDIAMLVRIRPTKYPTWLQEEVRHLLRSVIVVCESTREIVDQLDLLVRVSFSGHQAEKVLKMIDENGKFEHETDKIGYKLARSLYEHEAEFSPVDIFMLNDVFKALGGLANSAERVAKGFRLYLAHT